MSVNRILSRRVGVLAGCPIDNVPEHETAVCELPPSLQVARDVEGERAMLEVQVLIPQPFMGTIIGTGGAKIKELRTVSLSLASCGGNFIVALPPSLQRTRTNIKIFSEPMPSSNERSIQLMGSREQILECIQYFLDEISKA